MKPKTQKAPVRHIADIIAIAILVFGVVLAFVIPDSILKDYPQLRYFTDVMVEIVPSIEQLARVSRFPEVTLVFSAMIWPLFPIFFGIFLFVPGMLRTKDYIVEHARKKKWIFALAVPVFIAMVYWLTHMEVKPGDLEKATMGGTILRAVSESRFWMGLLGTSAVIAAAQVLVIAVTWLRFFRQIYFSNR